MKREPRPGERDPLRELYEQYGANEYRRLHDANPNQFHTSAMNTETSKQSRPNGLSTLRLLRSEGEIGLGDPSLVRSDTSIVLTGRKRVGKTYFAKMLPHEPLGFADPMGRVCLRVLGHTNREDPDVRRFLINLGALGRGVDAQDLPHELRNSIDWRALGRRLQRDGAEVTGMGDGFLWREFGRASFWIDVLEARVEASDSPVRERPQERAPRVRGVRRDGGRTDTARDRP